MKIRVVPRKWFLERRGTGDEGETFGSMNVISIITPPYPRKHFEDEDIPFSEEYRNADNVLVVKFHDATAQVDGDVVLMDESDSDKLYSFVRRTMGNGKDGYVIHCTAGKSRSQAVGHVLNEWFNGENGVKPDKVVEMTFRILDLYSEIDAGDFRVVVNQVRKRKYNKEMGF